MTRQLEHIVCIDDEGDILEIAQIALEDVGGYRVTCLNSGAQALREAAGLKPDAILIDVMMPGMDGPTTLQGLRAQSELDAVPVIFMTARVQRSEIDAYLALGANGVIHKPFDPMQLATQVRRIWEQFHGL